MLCHPKRDSASTPIAGVLEVAEFSAIIHSTEKTDQRKNTLRSSGCNQTKKGVNTVKHKSDALRQTIPAAIAVQGKMTCRHREPTG